MEQFSLEKWLQDKSRKVVTRDGREVTIEKTDIHIHGMSHMILGKYDDIYEIWHSNGRINYTGSDCNLDFFFADEEEELTEFVKEIKNWMSEFLLGTEQPIPNKTVKQTAKKVLDLARKEIQNEYKGVVTTEAYNQGREDTLKEIQRWNEEDYKTFLELDTIIYQNTSSEDYGRLYDWFKSKIKLLNPHPHWNLNC